MPYLLLIIGCFLLFFSVLILNTPTLLSFDLAIVEWASHHRTENLNQITTLLSAIGGMPAVLFFTTLWSFYLTWYKKYTYILLICLGLIGSGAFAWLLKYWIARPRPPEIFHLVQSYGASFPSAHSVYAAALSGLVIYLYRGHSKYSYICCFAVIWFILMGCSRVYLGVHFPSDVLAGWGISFIWITLLYIVLQHTMKQKII
ncbi:phosphatase PAP2 family protein [Acinetobacter sp. ANC 4178]|uniref:phosphatase PAP2 family protein n=1 Tax=Acinetobacter sp. ANC 4178 TaxID=2529839 RepID=UPI00103EE4D6|nr:phosphatase PAP2 family protein [Acinetobacter sp. ANC 4178]TCB66973.1 phosphatase PAP2 family protein [Acinetobacter sp. ANC 4178]